VRVPDLPKRPSRSEEESAEILLKEINALCQQLNASDRSTPDLKALKGVKYSLSAVIALANGSWALPEKDVFHHNRNTWAETAGRMGAGKAPKRKPGPTGANTSTECIGPVKGKRGHKYSDPYAAGERSGKRAKPDAVSAAANERSQVPALPPPGTGVLSPARASPSAAAASSAARSFTRADRSTTNPLVHLASGRVPGLAFSRFPAAPPGVHSPARASPSAAAVGSAAPSFTRADRSTAYPLAYLPSGAAPGYAFSLLSAAPLGYALAPPSAAFPELGYTGNNSQTSFRAEIMPGNAPAHTHFFPGSHST